MILVTVSPNQSALSNTESRMSDQELNSFLKSKKELRATNRLANLFKQLCLILSCTLVLFFIIFTEEIKMVLREYARQLSQPTCERAVEQSKLPDIPFIL